MPNLVGTGLNQVPTNGMLGGLAYQSPDHASIKDLDLKNLSQINSEIADTALDIFIYDTSKDSDGGAWRHRTSHTSWYNEELNTATRGSRREFPAVAVIVVEPYKVTIYDGDDPDLPLWSSYPNDNVFDTPRSVHMLNGVLVWGSKYDGNSDFAQNCLCVANFITEIFKRWSYSGSYSGTSPYRNNIRNAITLTANNGYDGIYSTFITISPDILDVDMVVKPNAPIDPATGLPVPTIVAAAIEGLGMIKDDGTVVSWTADKGYDVAFDDHYRVVMSDHRYSTDNSKIIVLDENLSSRVARYGGTADSVDLILSKESYNANNITTYNGHIAASGGLSDYSALQIIYQNDESPSNGMHCVITSDYNTGWLHGNCKGAFLSDTDATNVTGTELITNGTFGSDVSGWSSNYSTITHQSGQAKVTALSTGILIAQQLSGLVVGKKYVVTATVTPYIGTNYSGWSFYLSNNYTSIIKSFNINNQTTTIVSATFTATATDNYISFGASTGAISSSEYMLIDNISVRLAEEDRSVNNNGLQVFGTITKSAVATGAELVAYSGFSASNYLKQPYNSSLVAGTGSQTFMGWVYGTMDSNTRYIFCIGEQDSNEQFRLGFSSSAAYFDYGDGSRYSQWNSNYISNNTWTFVVATITTGQIGKLYINGQDKGTPNINGVASSTFLTSNSYTLTIGNVHTPNSNGPWSGSLSLFRYSLSAPSPEQVKKIYEDEKVLFQENAACTLHGSSDAVTALAYDEVTERLHVGTSGGRSEFQGLRRINNTTTAVTTAISAYDSFVVEQ